MSHCTISLNLRTVFFSEPLDLKGRVKIYSVNTGTIIGGFSGILVDNLYSKCWSSLKASVDLINHSQHTPGDLLYHLDPCDISGACRDQLHCQRRV